MSSGWKKVIQVTALVIVAAFFCYHSIQAGEMTLVTKEQMDKAIERIQKQAPEWEKISQITVVDNLPGEAELPTEIWEEMSSEYSTNIQDMFSEEQYLEQADWRYVPAAPKSMAEGTYISEEVSTMHLNNVWFSVPKGGSRGFGIPTFTTEYMGEREREMMEIMDRDALGGDEKAFDEGMDETRALVADGYLQEYLADFLVRFPEIEPESREYTLYISDAKKVHRNEDDYSYWEIEYILGTDKENGQWIPVAYLRINKSVSLEGEPVWWDEAHWSLYPMEYSMWELLEEPEEDRGAVWVMQALEDTLTSEEEIRRFVETKGAGLILPSGVDQNVTWQYNRVETYWYDYLVYTGYTKEYELTMAVPLMQEGDGSWYMASLIKKGAESKEQCQHTLSVMMQTFRACPYVYAVRKGDTLSGIAEKYMGRQDDYPRLAFLNDIGDPDLIYPGDRIALPENAAGRSWTAGKR